ncbi:hypothetical protein CA51_46740 [Rosistilla oblonga]|uniref:Uncharacterized protein n=2 Tax=Rosistilla TaxID=2795779 RepID=A0A518IVH5_9BACT|nr:hypothetical protein EC9_02150 [Rosistilla ulvae]QDV14764.1 hypothetical protein CA51_46740 [Rosistilla oblonga]QDV57090.1 hypothetical protein Mal33_30910 [Rosistilla oblonga]
MPPVATSRLRWLTVQGGQLESASLLLQVIS